MSTEMSMSIKTRKFAKGANAILSRLSEMENNIFGVLICASGAYDWLVLYKGLNRVGLYYSNGVYVLSSLSILSIFLFALYSTLGGIILIGSKRVRSRYKTAVPNLVAIAAVFAPYLFVLMSKGNLLGVNVYAAYFCIISGALITLLSLIYLRRALTVTPQAISLVTTGPYSFVRHPMYSGSIVIMLGLMLLVDSAIAVGLFLVCGGLQIQRALYEEKLLEDSFSEYRKYKSHVGRFIPRLGSGARMNKQESPTGAPN